MSVSFPFPGLKADYPQLSTDVNGCVRTYLYLAVGTSLYLPSNGMIYLGHPIQQAVLRNVDLTTWKELQITTIQKAFTVGADGSVVDTAEGTDGDFLIPFSNTSGLPSEVADGQYPFFEIEWASLEKQLRQHPAWSTATPAMWTSIDQWEKETDITVKASFQYYNRNKDGDAVGSVQTLSTTNSPDKDMQDYAKLRLKGVEAFLDASPVARKTSRFRGWNAPATGDAGQKIGGDPFTGVPSGYEWLKTVDRSSKQGFGTEWLQQQEWTGARLILLDKDSIYI